MSTRVKVRVDFSPDFWIGPGRVELLERIGEMGSISAASRAMGMSYRRAWLLVGSMNSMFRVAAVETTLGGHRGGGAELTAFGREIITRYRELETSARRAVAPHLRALETALSAECKKQQHEPQRHGSRRWARGPARQQRGDPGRQ